MTISTLRPGLLVSLKSSVTGNVKYNKKTLESDHNTESGARRAVWETERTITDPAEHEAATKARSKARTLITSICTNSAFGLLCPESGADDLTKAIAKAREVADEFNKSAALTRVSVYVIVGRVAPDDVEAVKAINSEIRDLMEDMQRGLRNLDVKVIREAAGKAKSLGAMLNPDAAARVQLAVDAARTAARKLVQAGETAAMEVDTRAISAITEARTAFLDLDDASEVAAPMVDTRAIDFAPQGEIAAPAAPAAKIEMEA